jgi:hypothetical protein
MANPVQQNPGNNYNSVPSGIISIAGANGTGNTHTTTTIDTLNFNPQTGGLAGGAFAKGSLIIGLAGGHGSDLIVTTPTSASVTILTATSSTLTGTAVRAFNYPGLVTGEASALTNGNSLISSYYVGTQGTGGVLCQTDFVNAVFADLLFIAGAAFTPTAGNSLQGWFLRSFDGGNTFEKSVANTANPRAPDFIIPLFASAYAAGDQAVAEQVPLPAEPFKIELLNGSGATMPATWGIWGAPTGVMLTT